jgi:SAM-dependent methyltransferase
MRASAALAASVTWLDARAESTGLEGASADLVVAFQAFHWFERPAVLHEIERILRPDGRAAVVYNERDESEPFTAAYGVLVERFATDQTERRRVDGRHGFASWSAWQPVRVVEIGNEQRLDRAGVHARANSTSYLPHRGKTGDSLHAALDALFDEWARDGRVTLRLKTSITLGDRVDPMESRRL